MTKKSKQLSFMLNNKNLEIVQELTYLGVKLSSTGNFSAHLTQSREKALHAFFKVTRTIDLKKLKPQQANKLFNSLISPILTFGSEVWGVYVKQDFEKWDNSPTEKVHLRFCKYYLGVNRKASNIACRAELGRFPLKIFIEKLIFKYFNHLMNLPENSITKQAFLTSKSLHERNKPCYHSNLHKILNLYNIVHSNRLEKPITKSTLEDNQKIMKNEYLRVWRLNLSKSKKLEFYQSFKEKYEVENYLDIIRNFDQRRQFTKFRISNHKLAIETGRYGKPKIQVDQRLCIFCNHKEIETEKHMLLKCPFRIGHYDQISLKK